MIGEEEKSTNNRENMITKTEWSAETKEMDGIVCTVPSAGL